MNTRSLTCCLLSALALAATPLSAQTWMRELALDGSTPDVALLPNGEVVATQAVKFPDEARLTVLAPDGSVARAFRYAPIGFSSPRVRAVAASPAGHVMMALETETRPLMVGVDPATGTVLWDHAVPATGATLFGATALSDGSTLAFGASLGVGTEGLVIRMSAAGQPLWQRVYGDSVILSAAEAVDGGLFLTADGSTSGGSTRVLRIGPGGATLWEKDYAGGGAYAGRIAPTADGGAFLVGLREVTDDSYEVVITRLDASGGVEWSRSYQSFPTQGTAALSLGDPVALKNGGCAVLCGQPVPDTTPQTELAVLRVDALGDVDSYRLFTASGAIDRPVAMHATPAGGLLFAGRHDDTLRIVRTGPDGLVDSGCGLVSDLGAFPSTLTTVETDDVKTFAELGGLPVTMHVSPLVTSATSDLLCGNLCQVLGGTLGFGLAGTDGVVPRLEAQGGYCVGDLPALRVTDALPVTWGTMYFSFGSSALPVFGGWLWIDFSSFAMLPIATDPLGEVEIPLSVDLSKWSGLTLYTQAGFLDPGAVQGVSLTAAGTLAIQ